MAELKNEKRARVLDPIERVSEIIFGLIMALSFTGTLSAATAGREEIRTVLFAALGCNLAWGLVDGVMYLVALMTERTRNFTLLRRVRSAATPHEAHAIIADVMPGRLGRDDFVGALGVFLIVVLSTFPVVVPFMLFSEVTLAMRVSNAIALVTLFACGFTLGRYAGGIPWRSGFAMAAIGAVLVAATIALGG